MRINKVRAKAGEKVSEYPRMERIIEGLERQKETGTGKDINSFIRSKNKINRGVEGQAIKNISIDELIEKYREWQLLIKNLLLELKQEDETKAGIVESKFSGGSFEKIGFESFVSRETARKYYNDFVLEVLIVAIKEKLIKIE